MKNKNYPKKSSKDYQKEINQYMSSATEKIDSYIMNKADITELLDFMAQFHHYSLRNQLLIQDQFDGASAVGSFKAFSEAGFRVNKGEKAIKVLVPTPVNYFINANGESKRYSFATKEEKQLIAQKKLETMKKMHFKLGNVFDVSQTNATAEDLPKIFPNRPYNFSFEGNEEHFLNSLKSVSRGRGVPVSENKDIGVAKGQYSFTAFTDNGVIELNPRFDKINQSATLIHEMAHATLHHAKDGLSKAEREFQAELVSHVVSKHFRLDTEEKSIPYIATWTDNGQKIEDKRKLLKGVQEASSQLITDIHEKYNSVSYDNTNEKEVKQTITISKEEIAEAKKVSILDVGSSHGLHFTKHSNKEYRLDSNKSIAIFTDTNSFSDFAPTTTLKGGDSIAFVQQVIGVTDFKEAVKLLTNESFERVEIQSVTKENYKYDSTKESKTFNKASNYLVNERGIDRNLVNKLHEAGYIREDIRGNVLFCWYDENKMVGCTEQGTIKSDKYERGSWKGIQKNSPANSHGFNLKFGEPEHLKFFEASIDALSYASLNSDKLNNTWLISMEGLNENKMLDYVKRSHSQTGSIPKSMSICVDNDSSGLNFFNGLSRIKKELLTNEIPQKPQGMEHLEKWDWNDQLRFFTDKQEDMSLVATQSEGQMY